MKHSGYEIWARKHNLKAISNSVYEMRNLDSHSKTDLDNLILEKTKARQELLNQIKAYAADVYKF